MRTAVAVITFSSSGVKVLANWPALPPTCSAICARIASASSVEVFARMSETAEVTRFLFKLSYFEAAACAEYFVPPGLPSKTKVSAFRSCSVSTLFLLFADLLGMITLCTGAAHKRTARTKWEWL